MARVRRTAPAAMRMRLNLEIVGIAAFGLATLLGIALSAPTRSGAMGAAMAHALVTAFGGAAWLVPALVALFGGIVFLEINVPRTIATLGFASLCYFFIADAFYGRSGGALGIVLQRGLRTLVGTTGATLVLVVAALAIAVWITNVSVKRAIGFVIVQVARFRAFLISRPKAPRKAPAVATPPAFRPASIREAFDLPPEMAKPQRPVPTRTTGTSAAPGIATGTGALGMVGASGAPGMASPAGLAVPRPGTIVPLSLRRLFAGAKSTTLEAPSEADRERAGDEDAEKFDGEELDEIDEIDEIDDLNAAADDEDDDDDEDEDDDEDDEDEVDDEDPGDEVPDDEDDDEDPGDEAPAEEEEDDDSDLVNRVAAMQRPGDRASARAVAGEYEAPSLVASADPERRTYRLPDLGLFDPPQAQIVDESHRSHLLEDTLASFGVGAKVTHIERGPSITRYELKPERGVKISRISALSDDIALALAAISVRIEAPIPGKSAVGIEVPNAQTSIVAISEILQAIPQRGTVPPLHMALGKDITGRPVFGDLGKMPHLLVAGATGSGKSVCLNGIIASLLVSATPDQVQMLFIDPKRVELTVYNGIPHLIKEVITDARLAAGALYEMTREMDARYERFAKAGVRKIEEFNAKYPQEKLPFIVIIIDELADLMLVAPAKVETSICRLAQLARATGIHLVVATQRPSVDVITGLVKANIPSRIAFAVSSQIDSRTILDMGGAERLLGRGDMLYLPIDAPKPIRAQGALITGPEVTRLVEFWANQARPDNLLDVEIAPVEDDDKKRDVDPLCYEAARFIIETDYASTAQLQSRFAIGHPRAVRVMKQLEEFGVVGQHEGTKPRRINVGLAELETIADRLGKSEQTDLFAQGA